MKTLESETLSLMDANKRISPAFLACKLKITADKAQELFLWGYMQQAKNAFYLRRFGMNVKEYEASI